MSATGRGSAELRIISAHRKMRVHVAEIWEYRELLDGLIRKELKVRYKNSVLGFVWSMVQPVFLLGVYTLVFSILGAGFDDFPIWLLCGLIPWTLVSTTLSTATTSVVANQGLVSKVPFPRAVLPLATLGSALVHFVLQMCAFGIVLVIVWHPVDWSYIWLLPIALLVTAMLLAGMSLVLATLNVYARDTQHLLELALVAMFWANPIVYQYERAAVWFKGQGLPGWLPLLNPFTSVITTFQRTIYGTARAGEMQLLPDVTQWWYLRNLTLVGVLAVCLMLLGLFIFDRAEGNFAEVL
ncbi:MAG: ABC transporter permease [Actinomycetota bacterium]|nr:ABC transporter permease [Actinomycetota bacterium]